MHQLEMMTKEWGRPRAKLDTEMRTNVEKNTQVSNRTGDGYMQYKMCA